MQHFRWLPWLQQHLHHHRNLHLLLVEQLLPRREELVLPLLELLLLPV
jgi:hypothetical protein